MSNVLITVTKLLGIAIKLANEIFQVFMKSGQLGFRIGHEGKQGKGRSDSAFLN